MEAGGALSTIGVVGKRGKATVILGGQNDFSAGVTSGNWSC